VVTLVTGVELVDEVDELDGVLLCCCVA